MFLYDVTKFYHKPPIWVVFILYCNDLILNTSYIKILIDDNLYL